MSILRDPDVFVQWNRTEEPGENPRWESQCGYVEQIQFGDYPQFQGFVGHGKTPLLPKNILWITKKEVETEYQKTSKLVWAYES